jgi:hypothetical protein
MSKLRICLRNADNSINNSIMRRRRLLPEVKCDIKIDKNIEFLKVGCYLRGAEDYSYIDFLF